MKLRNKKTGEIWEIEVIKTFACGAGYRFDTLAELNEAWEDYEPKEPLIKDEKIRKAVRAWAEANGIDKIIIFDYINDSPYTSAGGVKFAEFGGHTNILFRTDEKFDTDKIYTVTELCGEEE